MNIALERLQLFTPLMLPLCYDIAADHGAFFEKPLLEFENWRIAEEPGERRLESNTP